MDKIIKIENEIEVLKEQCKKLKEEKQNEQIRKATQKRYPELDLSWFNFVDNKVSVFPKGSHGIAGCGFTIYGIKSKIRGMKKKGIFGLNKNGCLTTRFTREESELFYNEILSNCGYLLFPCWSCEKNYQLEELYTDKDGKYENQNILAQLTFSHLGRCKSCSDKRVKEFNTPRPYIRPIVDKGGRWKGSYKLSDGGGGLRD